MWTFHLPTTRSPSCPATGCCWTTVPLAFPSYLLLPHTHSPFTRILWVPHHHTLPPLPCCTLPQFLHVPHITTQCFSSPPPHPHARTTQPHTLWSPSLPVLSAMPLRTCGSPALLHWFPTYSPLPSLDGPTATSLPPINTASHTAAQHLAAVTIPATHRRRMVTLAPMDLVCSAVLNTYLYFGSPLQTGPRSVTVRWLGFSYLPPTACP